MPDLYNGDDESLDLDPLDPRTAMLLQARILSGRGRNNRGWYVS